MLEGALVTFRAAGRRTSPIVNGDVAVSSHRSPWIRSKPPVRQTSAHSDSGPCHPYGISTITVCFPRSSGFCAMKRPRESGRRRQLWSPQIWPCARSGARISPAIWDEPCRSVDCFAGSPTLRRPRREALGCWPLVRALAARILPGDPRDHMSCEGASYGLVTLQSWNVIS